MLCKRNKCKTNRKTEPTAEVGDSASFLNNQYRTRHEANEDTEELKLSIALSVKSAPTLASLC